MRDKRYWLSLTISAEQEEAMNHYTHKFNCSRSDMIRNLLLPFVFSLDSSSVPIPEADWKEFLGFLEKCQRMREAL
jgi:hypothetical protein